MYAFMLVFFKVHRILIPVDIPICIPRSRTWFAVYVGNVLRGVYSTNVHVLHVYLSWYA